MGRPSLAEQRRKEILAAVGRCAGRYGVSGTTLERVSAECGLSRGHIRHYLGNRDSLIAAFADGVGEHYAGAIERAMSAAPDGERVASVLDVIFGREWAPSGDNAAIDALFAAAATDEALASHIRATYLAMEKLVATALHTDLPAASARRCTETAYALISMAFGNSTLSQLGFPANRKKAARASADALVEHISGSLREDALAAP